MTLTRWVLLATAVSVTAVLFVVLALTAGAFGGDDGESEPVPSTCPPDQYGRTPWQTPAISFGLTAEQLAEQRANVAAIFQELAVEDLGEHEQRIALITVIEESKILNLDYGDRDSLGMYQQRTPWGSATDRMDPVLSTRMFLNGGAAAGTFGLLHYDYESMEPHEAAQTVQKSGTPDGSNYEKWLSTADLIIGCVASPGVPGDGNDMVEAASEWLGYPYIWGGGDQYGPTTGTIGGETRVGFDCSGLVIYAVWKASGGTLLLPHSAAVQSTYGEPVPSEFDQMQPGDLIHFRLGRLGPVVDHTGIYMGGGMMVNATRPCSTCAGSVKVDDLTSGWWATQPFTVRRVPFTEAP